MQRSIGKTGVSVFAIGLGAMPLSLASRPPKSDAVKVIHAAFDAGVDFVDTANVYCIDDNDIGHNEQLIAFALKSWKGKSSITIATKGGLCRPQGAWELLGDPKSLREACEKSLIDLDVAEIFLYQLHAPDNRLLFSEQIAALARLQEEGKIKHIGLSNVDASQIDEAQRIVRIETVQNKWNPTVTRDAHNGVFDRCKEYEMTYIAYSPVGGGGLHTRLANHQVLQKLALKHQASPYQIMLAWALMKGRHMLPIPGASKIASIIDSVHAVKLCLSSEDAKNIDDLLVIS